MNIQKITLIVAFCFPIFSCAEQGEAVVVQQPLLNEIVNYGYGNAPLPWLHKLNNLKSGEKFRILQLGDSHTAGDFFSDEVRHRLQKQWGNGGIGWVYPQKVAGQRNAQVKHTGNTWLTLSARKEVADFPLGGILARSVEPSGEAITQTLEARQTLKGRQNITLLTKNVSAQYPLQIVDQNGQITHLINDFPRVWQHHQLQAVLPISYQAQIGDVWEMGAVNIENQQKGVVLSAMGVNGAQLSQWRNWRADWLEDLKKTQADLVILAYGTNEAFNEQLDLAQTEKLWRKNIALIKKALPEAGIVVMGAPESLKILEGDCGTRPKLLNAVQHMQQRIAQQEQTLYWSWQTAMGGECSMLNWVNQGWGAKDGVHFSKTAYQNLGQRFAQAFVFFAKQ